MTGWSPQSWSSALPEGSRGRSRPSKQWSEEMRKASLTRAWRSRWLTWEGLGLGTGGELLKNLRGCLKSSTQDKTRTGAADGSLL
ncbi:hypothetical protein E2C01_020455 [Portunus trituberculatus]|uniref:Uncharacterized protein n=1 Tax=Portunus trituberculatus TaxID=210409 RepID=A0A5B7E0I1_PORTR|nr:hypothetical protein [Portunus trituberculatus]